MEDTPHPCLRQYLSMSLLMIQERQGKDKIEVHAKHKEGTRGSDGHALPRSYTLSVAQVPQSLRPATRSVMTFDPGARNWETRVPTFFKIEPAYPPTVERGGAAGQPRSINRKKTKGMVPSKMWAWSALLALFLSISLSQGFVLSPAGLRASVHAPAGVRSNRASSCWRGGKGSSCGISMQDTATAEEDSVAAKGELAWAESQFPGCSTVLSKVCVGLCSSCSTTGSTAASLPLPLTSTTTSHTLLCISGHLPLANSLHAHHLEVTTTY